MAVARAVTNEAMRDDGRRLMWHGMALFTLGLLTGLVQQAFENPRMGLAAHLEGLMNGTFLLALGAAWPRVRLSARLAATAYWTAICGTYGNWAVTVLAAALGTAAMTPIASAGHGAQRWQEIAITMGFVAVGVSILGASALLLIGLRAQDRHAAGPSSPAAR